MINLQNYKNLKDAFIQHFRVAFLIIHFLPLKALLNNYWNDPTE
jgi:hypothetical protein